MASSNSSSVSLLLLFNIVLLGIMIMFMSRHQQAMAARAYPDVEQQQHHMMNMNGIDNQDVKKPDCVADPDGSVLIPGVGRIMVPVTPGGGGLGGFGNIAGGDDTFISGPGDEIPLPDPDDGGAAGAGGGLVPPSIP